MAVLRVKLLDACTSCAFVARKRRRIGGVLFFNVPVEVRLLRVRLLTLRARKRRRLRPPAEVSRR